MDKKKCILWIALAILVAAVVLAVLFLLPEKPVFYEITFQDYDGTVLKTESVQQGCGATAPEDPARDGYRFVGWDRDYSAVKKDMIVKAEYVFISDVSFAVDTVTVSEEAEKVDVKISVLNNPGILGMVFSVSYDEQALKLVDCQSGDALSALAFQKPSRYASGCNFVWYGSRTGEVTDGEMLILTFEIAEGAKPGSYPVSVSWDDRTIYDSNSDMLEPDVIPGAIVIQ